MPTRSTIAPLSCLSWPGAVEGGVLSFPSSFALPFPFITGPWADGLRRLIGCSSSAAVAIARNTSARAGKPSRLAWKPWATVARWKMLMTFSLSRTAGRRCTTRRTAIDCSTPRGLLHAHALTLAYLLFWFTLSNECATRLGLYSSSKDRRGNVCR